MVKFQILLTVMGDCFLLECDAVYLGQMGTNDSDERAASIFRLDKKMGATLSLSIYMTLHPRRKSSKTCNTLFIQLAQNFNSNLLKETRVCENTHINVSLILYSLNIVFLLASRNTERNLKYSRHYRFFPVSLFFKKSSKSIGLLKLHY